MALNSSSEIFNRGQSWAGRSAWGRYERSPIHGAGGITSIWANALSVPAYSERRVWNASHAWSAGRIR
jgi:hypothetical protein